MSVKINLSAAARSGLLSLFVLAAANGCSGTRALPDGYGATENWTGPGGTADESGFSRLEQIDAKSVDRLGLAWSLDLDDERVLEATPLAVDGTLYFTGSYSSVYAVDGVSGKQLWHYDPKIYEHNAQKLRYVLPVNRGAAYADGRVFVGTLDGRLIALDAKTGSELWSVETVARDSKHTITGAPRTFNGKVIIGNGGADFGARGYVTAYDQKTGKQAWRFYTVPGSPDENKGDPAMEAAAKTWSGEYWKTGTGGTVWNGMTFDPELNRIYIGTGNSGPFDPEIRSPGGGGDNLYLTSIVALDADTGKYIWHYQENPREAWDYKATPNIISATLTIEGKPRKVLMHAPTNGFFYVLDRETGKLISAEKMGKVTWADHIDLKSGRPVEAPGIRYEKGEASMWPGPNGAHNWQDMSFNPDTGLVYIPYMQLGMKYVKVPGALGGLAMTPILTSPEDGKGALIAWDPIAQKVRWRIPHDFMWNGGTLTTAGNLVFQGTADGYFTAYDAGSGKQLWHFNAGLGIIARPVAYSAGGKEYVSVLVGYGGTNILGAGMNVGWKYGAQTRRLLTFALDSKGTLAPSAPRSLKVEPADDPAIRIDEADIGPGQALFMGNCGACHGHDAVSGGAPGPDLRESQIALQFDSLWQVVHDGALVQRGMPPFKDLDRTQVRQIHAFIRAKAREALGQRPKVQPAAGASKL